jgi:hypothetical protein
MWIHRIAALSLSVVLAVTPAIAQQGHVVDQAAIELALTNHIAEEDSEREAVLNLLRRQEVRKLASNAGIDLLRAEAAVSTLEGEELSQLASMALDVEEGLSGGSNITISTTVIIIALLLLILIIVAT